MPLKNYTTTVAATRSIQEIQEALVRRGATGISFGYEKGTGRIESLKFTLPIAVGDIGFSLPVEWRRFQQVLKDQRVRRWDDEEHVYRVAWRNIRDWVLAQLALNETAMVEMPQVFLPFAVGKNGHTLYETVIDSPLLLTSGAG